MTDAPPGPAADEPLPVDRCHRVDDVGSDDGDFDEYEYGTQLYPAPAEEIPAEENNTLSTALVCAEQGTLLKRSEWLMAWNPRQVKLLPGGDEFAPSLQWSGGPQMGAMALDGVTAKVVDDVLVVRNVRTARAVYFRSAGEGIPIEQWATAIEALMPSAPPCGAGAIAAAFFAFDN